MRNYQIKQLPIVMVPLNFTMLALLGLILLPSNYVLTAISPVLYWSAIGGIAWTSMAWVVFQMRISRARKELGGEGQA